MSGNKEFIQSIRKSFLKHIEENEDLYHKNDVQLVNTNDWWIERHVLDNKSEDSSLNALIKAMKWRKSFGVNDFTDDYFPEEVYKIEMFNTTALREYGRRVLWYRRENCYKSSELALMIRQFAVYCFEKLDKQTTHECWALLSDATNADLVNVDLDFSYFIIDVLQSYYPHGIKYMIVASLPQVLNQTANNITNDMNEYLKSRVQFIKANELSNYFDTYIIAAHLSGNNSNSLIEISAGVKTLDQ